MKPHRSRLAIAALAASALLGTACGEGTTDTGTEAPSDGGVNASTLPDCPVGAFENETGSTKVVLWTSAVGATLATLRSIATDYNSSQNKVEVVVETQGIKYEELRKNFETGVSAKQLPAIVMGEDTWTQYMIDNGVTMPAQACINADDDERAHAYDDMLPGVTAAYTSSEVLWPGAFGASTVVLYFNKNHFTAAGLDPENPPTTYAEVQAAAEQLKASVGAGNDAYKPLALRLDSWFVENTTSAEGETFVNNDNGRNGKRATESTMNNPATVEMLDWLATMKDEGLLNTVESSSLIDHYLAVATESSSMLLETSTSATLVDQITSSAEGLDISQIVDEETAKQFEAFNGFKVPFTVGLGKGPSLSADKAGNGQVAGAAFYMTNSGSDAVVSGAWDFIKYFNDTPQQVRWTREGSYMPTRAAAVTELEADPAWADSQRGTWINTAYESMKDLDASFPGPLVGPYLKVRATVQSMLETIALPDSGGAADRVAPALDEAVAQITSDLANYNSTTR